MNKDNLTNSNFGKKGWLVIIFTLILYLISSTPPDTLNVSVTAFAANFGWDSNAMLSMSGIGGFVGIAVSLVFGLIVAKWGVKWPLVGSLVVYAVIWFLHGQMTTFGQYCAVIIAITAVSNAINLVPTQQIMNNWFPRKKGIALGYATAGMCISGALMIPVFQGMFGMGIGAPFFAMAIVSILLAAITGVAFKAYPEQAGAYPDNIPVSEEESKKAMRQLTEHKSDLTVGRLLRNKNFWLISLVFGFLFMGLVGSFAQLIPRMSSVGIATETAILWCTLACIIGIVGSFVWGVVDQKIGTKPTVIIFAALWTLMNVLAALGSYLVNIPLTMISVVMLACFIGGLGNLMPSMIIQVFGRYNFHQANKIIVPVVIGIRSFALIIVSAILAASGGNIHAGYGNVFIVFSVLSLLAVIMSVFLGSKVEALKK